MRSVYLLLLLVLLSSIVRAQTMPPYPRIAPVEDEGSVPDSMRGRFRDDALRLAVGWLNERKLNREEFVDIPDTLVTSIYQGLLRCWAVATERERTVIHESPAMWVELQTLYLVISADSSRWINAWKADKSTSGNIEADRLMSAFGMTAQAGLQFQRAANVRFSLTSSRPINIHALECVFAKLPGVILDLGDEDMSDIFCQGKPTSPLIVEQRGIHWHFRFCTECEDPYYDNRAVAFDVIVDGNVQRPKVE